MSTAPWPRALARPTAMACLSASALLGGWQAWNNYNLGIQRELMAEATVLAQRMAWASNLVMSEDQNALSSLKESKSRVGLLLSTLQLGGRLDGRSHSPLMPALQAVAIELNRAWQPLENACTSVLEGEPVAVNDPRFKAIRVGLDQASLSLEKILQEHRRNSPKDANELATMDELLFSLQAISQVLSLTEPGARPLVTGVDPEKIVQTLTLSQAVIDRLMNGHRESNLKPAPETERVRLLGVRNDLATVLRGAESVAALLPKLSANIEASRQVGKHAENLRIQLMLNRRKLNDPYQTVRWLAAALLGGAGILLLGLLTPSRRAQPDTNAQDGSASLIADPLAPPPVGPADTASSLTKPNPLQQATHGQNAPPAGVAAQTANPDTQERQTAEPQVARNDTLATTQQHDVLDPVDQTERGQAALKGVISALQQLAQNTGRAVEQSEQTIKAQAETLKANAQLVLQLAHAFHNISTETTEIARTALRSQKQISEHQNAAGQAISHWEDVRDNLMKTASKLRRAGEVSRELSQQIERLPVDQRGALPDLLAQTREALRDAVTGLAEGSVQINYGQRQAQEVADVLGLTQQQWIEMLSRIEVCAGTSAAQTQTALTVSRNLSRAATPGMKLPKPGE